MFDSIQESLTHKPSLYGDYNTRNSFISNYRAQVRGVMGGITFNKNFTVAISYNWLISEFNHINQEKDTAALKMRYVAPFVSYSFLEKKNLQLTVPVYLGFGQTFYQTKDKKKSNSHFILTYEPSMKATYRVFKYIGISAGVGFRMLIIGNKFVVENFNSPTYTVGVNLFMGDIYRDVKKRLVE
jgi:hypothetical protein